MNKIKHLLHSYSEWIKAVLAPLGPWGMLAFAAVDGSFMGLPLDAIFVGYVYHDRSRFWLYILLGATGSALGSIVLYVIGYTGGEVLLRKRLSPERFEKIHASFDKHEFWALMFPAMLPPPTPFKIVVLAAAAFEMRFTHFLLAIFAGRFVRFLIEALLTLAFGPQIVGLVGGLFRHHLKWILAGVALLAVVWLIWWRRRKPAANSTNKNAAEEDDPALRSKQTLIS
ncbi:MAG: VTT domain-containing protein [Acidobacteriia bacterium]|nr:VTT domain-containing protein [Terriglobia bacterium]